jgi:hypothetical protein
VAVGHPTAAVDVEKAAAEDQNFIPVNQNGLNGTRHRRRRRRDDRLLLPDKIDLTVISLAEFYGAN